MDECDIELSQTDGLKNFHGMKDSGINPTLDFDGTTYCYPKGSKNNLGGVLSDAFKSPNNSTNHSNELAEAAKNINDAGKNASQLNTTGQTLSKVTTDAYQDTGNLGKALDGWSAANNVVDAYKHYKNGDIKEAIVSGVKAGFRN